MGKPRAYIYSLIDCAGGHPFYVGVTQSFSHRMRAHKSIFGKRVDDVVVLEEVDANEMAEKEEWWINYMIFVGANLENKSRKSSIRPISTQRDTFIRVVMSKEEKDIINKAAYSCGGDLSQFVRMVMKKEINKIQGGKNEHSGEDHQSVGGRGGGA
jgi:predicted GIY-YIG superfamily endonuclease